MIYGIIKCSDTSEKFSCLIGKWRGCNSVHILDIIWDFVRAQGVYLGIRLTELLLGTDFNKKIKNSLHQTGMTPLPPAYIVKTYTVNHEYWLIF